MFVRLDLQQEKHANRRDHTLSHIPPQKRKKWEDCAGDRTNFLHTCTRTTTAPRLIKDFFKRKEEKMEQMAKYKAMVPTGFYRFNSLHNTETDIPHSNDVLPFCALKSTYPGQTSPRVAAQRLSTWGSSSLLHRQSESKPTEDPEASQTALLQTHSVKG